MYKSASLLFFGWCWNCFVQIWIITRTISCRWEEHGMHISDQEEGKDTATPLCYMQLAWYNMIKFSLKGTGVCIWTISFAFSSNKREREMPGEGTSLVIHLEFENLLISGSQTFSLFCYKTCDRCTNASSANCHLYHHWHHKLQHHHTWPPFLHWFCYCFKFQSTLVPLPFILHYDLTASITISKCSQIWCSCIPGHWVQPPPPADETWASYLVRSKWQLDSRLCGRFCWKDGGMLPVFITLVVNPLRGKM